MLVPEAVAAETAKSLAAGLYRGPRGTTPLVGEVRPLHQEEVRPSPEKSPEVVHLSCHREAVQGEALPVSQRLGRMVVSVRLWGEGATFQADQLGPEEASRKADLGKAHS